MQTNYPSEPDVIIDDLYDKVQSALISMRAANAKVANYEHLSRSLLEQPTQDLSKINSKTSHFHSLKSLSTTELSQWHDHYFKIGCIGSAVAVNYEIASFAFYTCKQVFISFLRTSPNSVLGVFRELLQVGESIAERCDYYSLHINNSNEAHDLTIIESVLLGHEEFAAARYADQCLTVLREVALALQNDAVENRGLHSSHQASSIASLQVQAKQVIAKVRETINTWHRKYGSIETESETLSTICKQLEQLIDAELVILEQYPSALCELNTSDA